MDDTTRLYQYTLSKLKAFPTTRTIPDKLEASDIDRATVGRMLGLIQQVCQKRSYEYDAAIADFAKYCFDFLRLQMELERTGRYACQSFVEARREVYDNPEVMSKKYLNGLFLSQALWINHLKMFSYFRRQFCTELPDQGLVLEVPVGTGIFIAEFINHNPRWEGYAYDLSASAVAFSRDVISLHCTDDRAWRISLAQSDVFELDEKDKYDRVICGELLEHLEYPEQLLKLLRDTVKPDGRVFLTTAIWAASPDHIYLFKSAQEVREMLDLYFTLESELVLNVDESKSPEDEKTPINYACILMRKE